MTTDVYTKDLFGETLKDEGIQKVARNNQEWMEEAVRMAEYYIGHWRGEGQFDGDDIRSYVTTNLGNPFHPNAWGALINTLVKKGLIVRCGYRKSERPSAHARIIQVYRRRG